MMDADARARELAGIVADELESDAWRVIVVKAIDQAKGGDAKARAWLTDQIALTPEQLAEMIAKAKNSGLDFLSQAARELDAMSPEEREAAGAEYLAKVG